MDSVPQYGKPLWVMCNKISLDEQALFPRWVSVPISPVSLVVPYFSTQTGGQADLPPEIISG